MGDITKPMVVLIHGAPGSISDWKELVSDSTMFDAFRFVIVDRLGYGRSEQGKSVTDFTQQSQSIFSVISSLPNES
jgi:pimeloyl-ACP methyl ester carboxylesterase